MAVRICAWNKIWNKDSWLVCMEDWLCAYAHRIKYETNWERYGCAHRSYAHGIKNREQRQLVGVYIVWLCAHMRTDLNERDTSFSDLDP